VDGEWVEGKSGGPLSPGPRHCSVGQAAAAPRAGQAGGIKQRGGAAAPQPPGSYPPARPAWRSRHATCSRPQTAGRCASARPPPRRRCAGGAACRRAAARLPRQKPGPGCATCGAGRVQPGKARAVTTDRRFVMRGGPSWLHGVTVVVEVARWAAQQSGQAGRCIAAAPSPHPPPGRHDLEGRLARGLEVDVDAPGVECSGQVRVAPPAGVRAAMRWTPSFAASPTRAGVAAVLPSWGCAASCGRQGGQAGQSPGHSLEHCLLRLALLGARPVQDLAPGSKGACRQPCGSAKRAQTKSHCMPGPFQG